jgi:hypothetical protein
VVIPFEYFMHAARNVFGALLVVFVRGIAVVLRMLGNVVRHAGTSLTLLYDAVIFLPLIVERQLGSKRATEKEKVSLRKGTLGQPSVFGS